MMLFSALSQVLSHSERVTLHLDKMPDGRLSVIIQPKLTGTKSDLTEDQERLRAALALPLCVTDTPDILDNDFTGILSQYSVYREDIAHSLSVLDELNEAGKAGKAAIRKSTSAPSGVGNAPKKSPAAEPASTNSGGSLPEQAAPGIPPTENPSSLL